MGTTRRRVGWAGGCSCTRRTVGVRPPMRRGWGQEEAPKQVCGVRTLAREGERAATGRTASMYGILKRRQGPPSAHLPRHEALLKAAPHTPTLIMSTTATSLSGCRGTDSWGGGGGGTGQP